MTPASARSAGVVIALYFAYEVVAGLARELIQIGPLIAQRISGPDAVLVLLNPFLSALPYVAAGFVLFWLWSADQSRLPVFALIARAAVAAAGGAIISLAIGAITVTRVTGGWFTSIPREYSFPHGYFGQAPSMLVTGILENFPVLALAAIVGAVLLRRVLPNGHSDALKVTTRE